MRRALASFLLVLFSFPLIFPILRLDASQSLPSCCRREGKHHCSMGAGSTIQEVPTLSAVPSKCSSYPSTIAVHGNWNVAFLKNSPSIATSLVSYPPVETRAEAQYSVSFSRSRQKRGPPSFLD